MAWLGRIAAYVGPMLLEFLWGKIHRYLEARKKRKEEAAQNKAAADKFSAVVSNPDATREERKNAEDDLINGR